MLRGDACPSHRDARPPSIISIYLRVRSIAARPGRRTGLDPCSSPAALPIQVAPSVHAAETKLFFWRSPAGSDCVAATGGTAGFFQLAWRPGNRLDGHRPQLYYTMYSSRPWLRPLLQATFILWLCHPALAILRNAPSPSPAQHDSHCIHPGPPFPVRHTRVALPSTRSRQADTHRCLAFVMTSL